MEMWKENGCRDFCANEPHSEMANSPHSLGACENPADKKESVNGIPMDGHLFLGEGKEVWGDYVHLDKRVVFQLEVFSLSYKRLN